MTNYESFVKNLQNGGEGIMAEIIRETVTTQGENPKPIKVAPVEVKVTKSQTTDI